MVAGYCGNSRITLSFIHYTGNQLVNLMPGIVIITLLLVGKSEYQIIIILLSVNNMI